MAGRSAGSDPSSGIGVDAGDGNPATTGAAEAMALVAADPPHDATTAPRKTIVVSGNCQRAAVSAILGVLLPDASVTWVKVPRDRDRLWSTCDTWVEVGLGQPPSGTPQDRHPVIIPWPRIIFSGFHPDITYLKVLDESGTWRQHPQAYHSAIAFACWKHGMTADQAARVFNETTYAHLGYFDSGDGRFGWLQGEFERAGLDFEPARLALRRAGVFMNTINHPRMDAVLIAARQVLPKIHPEAIPVDDTVIRFLPDVLRQVIWPVYPDIAEHLGVPGSFRWRMNDRVFADVRSFLDWQWDQYAGLDPARVRLAAPRDQRLARMEELLA